MSGRTVTIKVAQNLYTHRVNPADQGKGCEDWAAQAATFTDEKMEQSTQQMDKGQLAFVPQMD